MYTSLLLIIIHSMQELRRAVAYRPNRNSLMLPIIHSTRTLLDSIRRSLHAGSFAYGGTHRNFVLRSVIVNITRAYNILREVMRPPVQVWTVRL